MSQSKKHTLIEVVMNTLVNMCVAYFINVGLFMLLKGMSDNQKAFWMTSVFTAFSMVRTYCLRRLFNWWQYHRPKKKEI